MPTNPPINELWEILVPANWNHGRKIDNYHHYNWDNQIRQITGGLTILPVNKGQWDHENEIYRDRMIPVRIACTEEQMKEIINLTLDHYFDQKAIMAYRISDKVIIQERA